MSEPCSCWSDAGDPSLVHLPSDHGLSDGAGPAMAGACRACDCKAGWDAHSLQGGAGWASRFARLAREVE